MRLPEPFCQFCHDKDGNLDYRELHAIAIGIGDALCFAPFWRAWQEYRSEWHYYTAARGITTTLWLVGMIRLVRRSR